jgi:glycosyltransferase involved in cell wall biosynthesis
MKVLQVPFTYHPDPCGGTEIYVEALARRLCVHGVDSVIAAPGSRSEAIEHGGLQVRRYAVNSQVTNLRDLYGEGDEQAAAGFDKILEDEKPDLVHLHAQTRAVSLHTVRAVRRRRIPVAYTYHTPTATCQRGTLLRWGNEVCEGVMSEGLCTACALQGRGLNRLAARAVAALPAVLGRLCGQASLRGGVWTAVRARELTTLRHQCARKFLAEADHIVAVCEWVRSVLLRNGVSAEKITLSRQGLCQDLLEEPVARVSSARAGALRVVFLGRLDPTKGVDILLRAMRAMPEAQVAVDIYGIAQGEAGRAYEANLRAMVKADARITFHNPVPAGRVVETLRAYDVLAVPSQWLETGPMVVLEAFAAGVPVLGSQLGGIAELVRDEVDGLLVPSADVGAWSMALRRLQAEPELLPRLQRSIQPPRTMHAAAAEMAALYHRLLAKAKA